MIRSLVLCLLAVFVSAPSAANERVVFATNWTAEAEHGGFYQALGEGLYAKAGLDVVIRQGGPQVSTTQLLASGAVDFGIIASSTLALNLARAGAPTIAVAAFFQKNPQILMAHPSQGFKTLADLRGHPIMISHDAWDEYWQFLKVKYGFTDDQIRPYTFDDAPFLASETAIMQGYLTNDVPILKRLNIPAQIFVLADEGYVSYGCVLVASARLAKEKPDLVGRFVAASVEGWRHYLRGDPTLAHALIMKDNPDYSQTVADSARQALIDYGIVEGGDAKTGGVGTMTEARWSDMFELMVEAGLYDRSFDFHTAYTTRFLPP